MEFIYGNYVYGGMARHGFIISTDASILHVFLNEWNLLCQTVLTFSRRRFMLTDSAMAAATAAAKGMLKHLTESDNTFIMAAVLILILICMN